MYNRNIQVKDTYKNNIMLAKIHFAIRLIFAVREFLFIYLSTLVLNSTPVYHKYKVHNNSIQTREGTKRLQVALTFAPITKQ